MGFEPSGGGSSGGGGPTVFYPSLARPLSTFIGTTFQSGHGWTVSGTASAQNLNDTSTFILGTQSATLTTNADGSGAGCGLRKLAAGTWDLTGKIPVVVLRCDDWTDVSVFNLYMGSSSLANYYLASYTDGLAATSQNQMLLRDNEWGAMTIPWANIGVGAGAPARNNITDLQVHVADKNGAHVPVHWNGVYFIPEQSTWANGVVSIVFDDGYDSQYNSGRPKLDQYGYAANAYVITSQITNNPGGYMTLAQLHTLEDQNGWSVCGHAFDVNVHNAWTAGPLDTGTVQNDITQQKAWLQSEGFKGQDHFAYPGGQYNAGLEQIVKQHYASARTLNNSTHETLAPWRYHRLRTGMYVINTTAPATVTAAIDSAFSNKTWLIMVFHKLVASPTVSTEYSITNFNTIIDYLNTKGIAVMTVDRVLGSIPQTG